MRSIFYSPTDYSSDLTCIVCTAPPVRGAKPTTALRPSTFPVKQTATMTAFQKVPAAQPRGNAWSGGYDGRILNPRMFVSFVQSLTRVHLITVFFFARYSYRGMLAQKLADPAPTPDWPPPKAKAPPPGLSLVNAGKPRASPPPAQPVPVPSWAAVVSVKAAPAPSLLSCESDLKSVLVLFVSCFIHRIPLQNGVICIRLCIRRA